MDLERRRAEAAAGLAETRDALELAWAEASGGDDGFHRSLKDALRTKLDAIDDKIKIASSATEFDSIERRCRHLATKRAYWFDAPEVQADADASIREIRTWGIPDKYFDEYLKPLLDTVRVAIAEASLASERSKYNVALRKAQSTLESIYAEYQYWDWYTSKYVSGVLSWIVGGLGTLGAASIVAALILAFVVHQNALAMFLAGLGGTCVSILLKQSPLAVYGDVVKSLIWSIGRLLTGVVATVIGMGLLTSGFINVGFSTDSSRGDRIVPLHVVVRGCVETKCEGSGGPSGPDGGAGADAGAREAARARVDGGVAWDGGADAARAPAPAEAARAAPHDEGDCQCPTSALLLMLGLAMLFGFSERAFAKILAEFEDKVAGGSPASTTPPRTATMPMPPESNGGTTKSGAPAGPEAAAAPAVKVRPPAPPDSPGAAKPPSPPESPEKVEPPEPPAQPADPAVPSPPKEPGG